VQDALHRRGYVRQPPHSQQLCAGVYRRRCSRESQHAGFSVNRPDVCAASARSRSRLQLVQLSAQTDLSSPTWAAYRIETLWPLAKRQPHAPSPYRYVPGLNTTAADPTGSAAKTAVRLSPGLACVTRMPAPADVRLPVLSMQTRSAGKSQAAVRRREVYMLPAAMLWTSRHTPFATRASLCNNAASAGHGDVLASHGRQGENTVTSHIWASRPQQGANYLQGKKFEFSIQKLSITFCPLPYKLEGGKFLPQFRRRRRGREGQALCDGACSPPPWC